MSETINKEGTCSICGSPYRHFGNNPEPVKHYHERCCDKCNWEIVIPIRIGKEAYFLGTWEDQRRRENLLKQGTQIYPVDWPRCPVCGDFALDGHLTCGRVQCAEGEQRDRLSL